MKLGLSETPNGFEIYDESTNTVALVFNIVYRQEEMLALARLFCEAPEMKQRLDKLAELQALITSQTENPDGTANSPGGLCIPDNLIYKLLEV